MTRRSTEDQPFRPLKSLNGLCYYHYKHENHDALFSNTVILIYKTFSLHGHSPLFRQARLTSTRLQNLEVEGGVGMSVDQD